MKVESRTQDSGSKGEADREAQLIVDSIAALVKLAGEGSQAAREALRKIFEAVSGTTGTK